MRFWSEFIWLLRRMEKIKTDLINKINTDIATEANARQAADTAEATARATADTAETEARTAADTAEASTRAAADTALHTKIDNKIFVQTGIPDSSSPAGAVWFKITEDT